MNRWLVVFGAILIQLALGALYAWSVFTKLLTDPNGVYQFTATQTAWIFSAGLATFALVMVLAGRWQAKTGPRLMTVLGGLLLGLGVTRPWLRAGRPVRQHVLVAVLLYRHRGRRGHRHGLCRAHRGGREMVPG
jgi:MFS family permease